MFSKFIRVYKTEKQTLPIYLLKSLLVINDKRCILNAPLGPQRKYEQKLQH
jgi:hypothetical protein